MLVNLAMAQPHRQSAPDQVVGKPRKTLVRWSRLSGRPLDKGTASSAWHEPQQALALELLLNLADGVAVRSELKGELA
jgi:hypothetical protein